MLRSTSSMFARMSLLISRSCSCSFSPTPPVMSFPEHRALLFIKLLPVVLVGMFAMLPSSPVRAIALGEAGVRSALGEKLDAEIDITSISVAESESLAVRMAPADLFAEAGLDYGALQRSLRLSIEKKADRLFIRVNSDLPVSDPFLVLLIEVTAAGNRTVRQYALLLDPPGIDPDARNDTIQSPIISAPPAVPEPSSVSLDKPRLASDEQAKRSEERAASETRIVRRGDTLSQFAREVVPSGATLEQAMLAFLQANPTAFEGKNIHRMKAGSVLRVPGGQTIADISVAQARREIALQTSDYHHYRDALARSAARPVAGTDDDVRAPSSSPSNRTRSGTISVKEAQTGKTDSLRDQLKLESATSENPRVQSEQENNYRELAQIANEKALAEANTRITELEKNIDHMQQQLAVRNTVLAETQERADQVVAGAAAPKPESSPASAPAHSPDETLPKRKVPAELPAANDHGWTGYLSTLQDQFAGNPLPVLGALGALSVGGLLLWLRSRLKQRNLPAAKVEPIAEGQTVFGQAGGRNIDTSNSVFHSNFVPSVSQLDANEVDAIAEADVYMAYGRDEQAEEILLDALKHHPQRHALRVKLLEIYFARKDSQKFGAVAAELRVMSHGLGIEWEQAAQMGQQLDPGNLLYGGTPVEPEVSSMVPVKPPLGLIRPDDSMSSGSAVEDFGLKLEGLLDERRKDSDTGLPFAPQSARRASDSVTAPDFQLSGIVPAATHKTTDTIGTIGTNLEDDARALKTKIDLALACQEIGDKEAARELLAEVAGTHHPELAGHAQSLLQQLA